MTLATEGVRLSAEQFDELFPFHLVFDRRFALIEAGKSMRHLVGTLEPGSDIRPHFRVIKPDQLMGFDDMLQRRQSLFVMQIIATGTLLRGQMLHLAEQDCIAFLGSPWMTEPDELTKLDLTVNDFAIHDPIVDMLQLLQHTRSALADSKKLAEQLTSQQRELRKLALIASRTDNAVILTDAQRRVVWVNDGFTRLTGYQPDEVLGKVPGRMLQGDHTDPATIATIREKLAAGMGFSAELINYRKDGLPYWVAIEVQPITDHLGRITNYMAIESDISRRKQAELELAKAKEQAEAANRAKSEFLAMMSHEIRTPLNGVIGFTKLLQQARLTKRQRDYVQTINISAETLLTLINDILDLSKIESGRMELENSAVDLNHCVTTALRLVAGTAMDKGIVPDSYIDPALPRWVEGDPARMHQVLLNLLGNAVKFTAKGEVNIALERYHDTLRIAVRDTGIGIPHDKQEHLFSAFTQADAGTTRRYGGTGLGLAISARLVNLMGGTIRVESEPGLGSLFEVRLPLREAERHGEANDIPPGELERASLPPLRILLAEDHAINRQLALLLLESMGCQADAVDNGRAAIIACEQHEYDVILMDLQMPEADGIEATHAIRALEALHPGRKRSRIIALTANAMTGERQRCIEAGMDGFVTKPIRIDHLHQALAGDPTLIARPQHEEQDDLKRAEQILNQLAHDIGKEAILQLFNRFIREIPKDLDRMATALQQRNAREGERLAHSLKGAAASFRLAGLQRQAKQLESLFKRLEWQRAEATLEELQKYFDENSSGWRALATQLEHEFSDALPRRNHD